MPEATKDAGRRVSKLVNNQTRFPHSIPAPDRNLSAVEIISLIDHLSNSFEGMEETIAYDVG